MSLILRPSKIYTKLTAKKLGLTLRAAHNERREYIKTKHPVTWPMLYGDKSILPNIFWVYGEHKKFMDQNHGSLELDGTDAYMKAQQIVSDFNF